MYYFFVEIFEFLLMYYIIIPFIYPHTHIFFFHSIEHWRIDAQNIINHLPLLHCGLESTVWTVNDFLVNIYPFIIFISYSTKGDTYVDQNDKRVSIDQDIIDDPH